MIQGAKQAAPTTMNSGRQFLDPKSFLTGQKEAQKLSKSSQQPQPKPKLLAAQLQNEDHRAHAQPDPAAEAEQGLTSYIEKLHGVTDRTERPAKRQKIQDEPSPRKKAQDIAIRGGGDLGEYVREKRKEGAQEAMANGVVDLTDCKWPSETSALVH